MLRTENKHHPCLRERICDGALSLDVLELGAFSVVPDFSCEKGTQLSCRRVLLMNCQLRSRTTSVLARPSSRGHEFAENYSDACVVFQRNPQLSGTI
jgi:hypothetical protein